MKVASVTSAIILSSYIQTMATFHVNFNYGNSTVLTHAVKIPKCCKEGSVKTDVGCRRDDTHKFEPYVEVMMSNSTHVNDEPVSGVQFESFIQDINCPSGSYPLLRDKDSYCLLVNGSLVLINQHQVLSTSQFCFETVNVDEENEKWVTSPFICAPMPQPNKHIIFFIIYIVCLTISCVTLSLICIIHGCLLINPLPQRKPVIFYSACLLGSHLVVGVAQIIQPTADTCNVLATLNYVFLIAALACVALITKETYLQVRKYERSRETRKNYWLPFIIYSLVILTLVTILLAFIKGVNVPRTFLKPELGQNSCWCEGEKLATFYFTLPVIVQIIINIVLLALSQISIKRADGRYSKNTDWERLKEIHFACIVVVILMVLCWAAEFATLVLELSAQISVAPDVIESLQGFIVFLLFIKLVKNDLIQRFKYNSCVDLHCFDYSKNTSETSIELKQCFT